MYLPNLGLLTILQENQEASQGELLAQNNIFPQDRIGPSQSASTNALQQSSSKCAW